MGIPHTAEMVIEKDNQVISYLQDLNLYERVPRSAMS